MKVAADKQARAYDSKYKHMVYKEGDLVLLDPHRLNLIEAQQSSRKLMQRHIGPFEIIEVINDNAYRLRLPDSYPMHNVVNVSHLRLYRIDSDSS